MIMQKHFEGERLKQNFRMVQSAVIHVPTNIFLNIADAGIIKQSKNRGP